jgi:type II secretory pathway pseudopilin PulG
MNLISILIGMGLAGQAERRRGKRGERGYAMAALLIAMSIMAVMMTVAMPVWKHQIQREREEELVFRGMQYVHAIALFQRKFANAYPPTLDVLVDQKFLRKKFKDPITNGDFALLPAGAQGTSAPGQTPDQGNPTGGRGSTVAQQPTQTQPGPGGQRGGPGPGAGPGGSAGAGSLRGVSPIGTPGLGGGTTAGIGGVASKSKDQSIRLYNGRGHYNEWAFVYQPQVQQAGQGGAPGTAQPGQVSQPPGQRGRGGPGTQPGGGQRGTSPFGGSNPFGGQGPGGGRGSGPGQPTTTTPRGRQ